MSVFTNLFCRLGAFLSLCLLAALSNVSAWGDEAVQVAVEAPAPVRAAVAPYLERAGQEGDDEQVAQRLTRLAKEILATEGYFSPTLTAARESAGWAVRIEPGPQTTVTAVEVTIHGRIKPEEREKLVANWLLPAGKPFRQADWTQAKQDLLARLMAQDHPAATLTNSLADVDPADHTARLYVVVDAGAIYRFGVLKIDGLLRYKPDLIDRYNDTVHPGEPYSEEKLAQLQRSLQSSPYFSSVQTSLDREGEEAAPDGAPEGVLVAPVRVTVREAAPHRLSFGVGASSNTGARMEANYRSNDLFRKAWQLNSGLRLEQKRTTAYADVFLPPDQSRNRDSFGALYEREDIVGLKLERFLIGGQRAFNRGALETRLSLTWQTEKLHAENADGSGDGSADGVRSRALAANALWVLREVDNILDPRRGYVLQAQVGGGAKALLSDSNFLRLHGRAQFYLPLGANNTLTLRGEAGRTFAASRQGIPQEFLFRTGGTGTVRGYAYQGLGVNEEGSVLGGRVLAVGSAELTHWINDQWGVAAFVDVGDAADTTAELRPAAGYGLGARWRSPAGPLAVDLAYGERDRRLRLHFFVAIPF